MKLEIKFFALFFLIGFFLAEEEEATKKVGIRIYHLNLYMKNFFSLNPQKNPFIRGLNEMADGSTTKNEINDLLGPELSKPNIQFEQSRRYAVGLVVAEMKVYQEDLPYNNASLNVIFKDFYDLMYYNLDVDSLYLNRETYVVFQ